MPPAGDIFSVDSGPLAEGIGEWADRLLAPYLQRHPANPHRDPKIIHDPVGKAILLQPWEVYIMDSPLMQRLRFIRQLGVGHFLFPTAGYSRFEHSVGCVQVASTLFDGISQVGSRPQVTYDGDQLNARRDIVRLAALLHDTGHCILSHVSEKFYEQNDEVREAQKRLRKFYQGTVAPAEAITILLLRSKAFQQLLFASNMRRTVYNDREIIDKVCACIAGSKSRMVPDAYLAEIVNGPVDCDKLDYLARDGHMAGLPISLDIDRLFSKLRIVKTVGDHGAPIFSLAIVPSGARALEEMLVSRIFLYDKFYYHPKVMAAEELVRRALFYLGRACPTLQSPAELLEYGDDEFLSLSAAYLANRYKIDAANADLILGCDLLARARARDLPKRAFAFAQRFIPEMPAIYGRFVNHGKEETVAQSVSDFMQIDNILQSPGGSDLVARRLREIAEELKVRDELFVATPVARRVAGKMDMPVLLPGDKVETRPDFLFDVGKWGDAYALNKQTSYVFAYDDLAKVHLAAERYFLERQLAFAPKSWVWTKVSQVSLEAERNSLPESASWLPHRLAPDFLEGSKPKAKLSLMREKFSTFLRSVDPLLGPQLMDGWLGQFPDGDLKDSALRLLDHITFVEKQEVIDGFAHTVERKANLREALWVPLRPRNGQGKSADQIKYDLQELKLQMRDIAMLDPEEVRRFGQVVFFDDLLNSGVQAECLLNSWFGGADCEKASDLDVAGALNDPLQAALREATIHFVYYSAHPVGVERVRVASNRLGLRLGDVSFRIDSGNDRYTLAGFTAASVASRARFIDYLRDRGSDLLRAKYHSDSTWNDDRCRSFALGFGGLELTLVYRHAISSAVPVALWQMSTEIMDPWLPIFPRDVSRLRPILNAGRTSESELGDIVESIDD